MISAHRDMHYRKLWLSIGYAMIIYVIYASLMPMPVQLDVPYIDKYAHVLAYFVLMGWFVQFYYGHQKRLILMLFFVGLGVALEFLQGMSGTRYFEIADMLANSLGVLLAWLLSYSRFSQLLFYIDRQIVKFLSGPAG